MRTSYRYLQHFITHPYLWRYLQGRHAALLGRESRCRNPGRRGEPFLCGDGYARIGEGSGSTNVLTGSGVDEAWTTGTQLAEAVLELLQGGQAASRKENLERTYVARRRASWVEQEGRVAEKARDGFHRGVVTGLLGMALAGFTGGKHCDRRRARAACPISPSITATRFPPPNSQRSWRTAARAASPATTR